jgi:glycosyl transferase family 25
MMQPFQGYFINLDRSPDRRRSIESELGKYGLGAAYARIAAVDGRNVARQVGKISPGAYGCFASHIQALGNGISTGQNVHILEDDAVLSPSLVSIAGDFARQPIFDQIDILFTEVGIRPDSVTVAAFDKACGSGADRSRQPVRLLDLKNVVWFGMTSYLVARRCVAALPAVHKTELDNGPTLPIDLRIRHLVDTGRLRAAVCLPFATSIDLELDANSTIRDVDRSRIATNIIRHAFFRHADPGVMKAALEKYCSVGALDGRRSALQQAITFTMFGDFRLP